MFNQYILPIVPGVRRYPTITPFTYRDGLTYAKTLEILIKAMKELIDETNEVNDDLYDTVVSLLNDKINEINVALNDQETSVDTKISDLTDFVNDSIDSVINASIVIQDPLVSQMVENNSSLTRVSLNNIFTNLTDFNSLETTVNILAGDVSTIENDYATDTSLNLVSNRVLAVENDYLTSSDYSALENSITNEISDVNTALTTLESEVPLQQDLLLTSTVYTRSTGTTGNVTGTAEFSLFTALHDMEIVDAVLIFQTDPNITSNSSAKVKISLFHRTTSSSSTQWIVSKTSVQEAIEGVRKAWFMTNGDWNTPETVIPRGDTVSLFLNEFTGGVEVPLPITVTIRWRPIR